MAPVGAAFVVQQIIHIKPEDGPHLAANKQDAILVGTDMFVLFVFLIVAGKVVVRLFTAGA